MRCVLGRGKEPLDVESFPPSALHHFSNLFSKPSAPSGPWTAPGTTHYSLIFFGCTDSRVKSTESSTIDLFSLVFVAYMRCRKNEILRWRLSLLVSLHWNEPYGFGSTFYVSILMTLTGGASYPRLFRVVLYTFWNLLLSQLSRLIV